MDSDSKSVSNIKDFQHNLDMKGGEKHAKSFEKDNRKYFKCRNGSK